MFVELKVDGHSDRSAAAISERLTAAPEVVAAHIVSGSADFLLEVVVADLAAYERLMFETLLRAAERRRRALELRAADGQAGRAATPSRTARTLPAGSLNQAMSGPWPRMMPFSSWSKPS